MSGATRASQKPLRSVTHNEKKNAAVGGSHWVGLKPRKTLSLPDALIFRGARKPIWDDVSKEAKRFGKDDDACFSLNYSHHTLMA